MNENIYNFIKKEYQKRQKAANDSLAQRKQQVYTAIPRVEEIDREIHFLGIGHTKAILKNGENKDSTVNELSLKINRLKEEKLSLLAQNSFARDFLELSYQCPSCKDTGFIDDGKVTTRCACYKQLLLDHIYNQSNLNLVKKENFESFNELYFSDTVDEAKYGIKISPRENILMIKERCLKFIENFSSLEEKNLFFSGPAGVGKTFMSSCIAHELLNRGVTVLYQTAPVLFDIINQHKFKSFKDEGYQDSNYKSIMEVELLIIDDLGTEPQSAARYAELLTILNTRHLNNMTKPCKTLISTNLGPKMLFEYYTERVASRIIGCFDRLAFAGNDIRSLKTIAKAKS